MGKPMTKERLERFRKAQADVDRLNRLASRQVRDTVKGSKANHPYTETTVSVSGLDARLAKRIRQKQAQVAAERQAVTAFVEGLEDVYIAKLIHMRYIDGKTWVDIWREHGCTGSVEGYRKTVSRFLDK